MSFFLNSKGIFKNLLLLFFLLLLFLPILTVFVILPFQNHQKFLVGDDLKTTLAGKVKTKERDRDIVNAVASINSSFVTTSLKVTASLRLSQPLAKTPYQKRSLEKRSSSDTGRILQRKAEVAWGIIKSTYWKNLKKYGINKIISGRETIGFKETLLANPSSAYANLKEAVKKELLTLIREHFWEAKIKDLIEQNKGAAKAWAKISVNYLNDLKKYKIKSIVYAHKESKLEETALTNRNTTYANLKPEVKKELMILLKDHSWEEKFQVLILAKKAAAIWITIQKNYFTDLKNLQINSLVDKVLINLINQPDSSSSYQSLAKPIQEELKNLVILPDWKTKLQALILDKKTNSQAIWEKIKSSYLDDLKKYHLTKITSEGKELISIVTESKETAYPNLKVTTKRALTDLLGKVSAWEVKLKKIIIAAKVKEILNKTKKFSSDFKKYHSFINNIFFKLIAIIFSTPFPSLLIEVQKHQEKLVTLAKDYHYEQKLNSVIKTTKQKYTWEKLKKYLPEIQTKELKEISGVKIDNIFRSDNKKKFSLLDDEILKELLAIAKKNDWERELKISLIEIDYQSKKSQLEKKQRIIIALAAATIVLLLMLFSIFKLYFYLKKR